MAAFIHNITVFTWICLIWNRNSNYDKILNFLGVGKTHNDAASVRTTHPVPAACGLYYFEVKIISKGRDGYMGIGLTAQNFKSNRLPGESYQTKNIDSFSIKNIFEQATNF